ncbi:hypothetical protein [Mangrovibacterium lignilyticum]|uniref:hypothetical protein n=1 Tax=Mangrovibacterium lignilyticum TaxID=2668052 RepID=UPI0013D75E08|nr:hypothetical protein [Mangrovibacterium lignilyticum]
MTTNTVSVFHFNPTCEIAIANGSPYYVPPNLLQKFEADLAPLMFVVAKESDIVICETIPGSGFVDQLRKTGLSAPTFMTKAEVQQYASDHPKMLFDFKPWGKSPVAAHLFKFLNSDLNGWDEKQKGLFERKASATFLSEFLKGNTIAEIGGTEIVPQIVTTELEIEELLIKKRPIVVKAPLSSSGRGLLVLRKDKLNEANRQWIKGVLEQQGYLSAEPWLNKQADLSFQFEIRQNGDVFYLGSSFFSCNSNGQYTGHFLNFSNDKKPPISTNILEEAGSKLGEELAKSAFCESHRGILGIDAIVYLDENHQLKLHPCLEINPRFTMGYFSQMIEQRIHQDAHGVFKIVFHPKGDYNEFAENRAKKNPPLLADGYVKKGFIALTPYNSETRFGAFAELF